MSGLQRLHLIYSSVTLNLIYFFENFVTKMTPCRVCAMLIINAGIKRVVCEKKYHAGKESEQMFRKAKIKIEYVNNVVVKYKNM